jgi:peroxiredoxin (alkyl hydroperoxide reductase subunit C)
MCECECCECEAPVTLGQTVPEFETAFYDPITDDFGTFKLADQKARKRWTVLFFYPADFTFV